VAITAWRIVKGRHAANAFDARLEGGRWNSPGTPLVYTSASAALAALEMLVHLGRRSILGAYLLIACTFEERLVERLDTKRLPPNWRSYPAPPELQMIGDEWARAATSTVLQVPSAVIETESNYLLNPRHEDFRAVRVGDPHRGRIVNFSSRARGSPRSYPS
jgi:RES domain-containing protein